MAKTKKIIVTWYGRVSTKAEAQKLSNENQPRYYKNLFKKPEIAEKYVQHKDDKGNIVMYVEWGVSGTKIDRPVFKKMIEAAGLRIDKEDKGPVELRFKPGHFVNQITYIVSRNNDVIPAFEEIWVKSTSRFARNIAVYDILIALRNNGVYVVFKDHNLTTREEKDLPTIRNLLDTDMFFSESLSKNIRMAKQQAVDEGILQTCGKLFGYTYHKRTKTSLPCYTINMNQKEIVEFIFQKSAEGWGDRRIANAVTEKGFHRQYTNAKNNEKFSPSTVRSIIKNEKYMGILNAGKFTTGVVFNKLNYPTVTSDYKDNLIEDSPFVPQIISPELWKKANDARNKRYEVNAKNKIVGVNKSWNEFSYILECGYCGSNFRHDRDKGKEFYSCKLKETQGNKFCNVNNVYAYKLDELVENLQNGDLNYIINSDTQDYLFTLIKYIEKSLNTLSTTHTSEEIQQAYKDYENKKQAISNLGLVIAKSPDNIKEIIDKQIPELSDSLKEAEERLKALSSTPTESLNKISIMLKHCDTLVESIMNQKGTYTRAEILEKLEKIKVYGFTQNSRGGRPPRPLLVPVLKDILKAELLLKDILSDMQFYIRDGISNEVTDKFESLNDKEYITLDDLDYSTKSHWYKLNTKITYDNEAFYTNSGELGYIKNLGVADATMIDQIKEKVSELKTKTEKAYITFTL